MPKSEVHETLEQLADRLERIATETVMLAQEVRRKAEEIGTNERRRLEAREASQAGNSGS